MLNMDPELGTSMGTKTQENGSTENRIEARFDEILGRHIERLLGTRYGIGGLPITINAISCIILLAEQVKNEKGGIARPEKYTRVMLSDELTEMCLDANEVTDTAIPAMIGRGYIQIDPDSVISIKENTIRMAQVLDRIFPTMPGINLVAYLAQAMDEVKTGRKSLTNAEDYLGQTLQIHGVALKKREAPHKQKEKPSPPDRQKTLSREIRASLTENRRFTKSKVIKGSDFTAAYQKPVPGKGKAPASHPDTAVPVPAEQPDREKRKADVQQPVGRSTGEAHPLEVQENPLVEKVGVVDEGDVVGEFLTSTTKTAGHYTTPSDFSLDTPSEESAIPIPPEKTLHDLFPDHEDTSSPSDMEELPVSEGAQNSKEEEPIQTAEAAPDEKIPEEVSPPIPKGDDNAVERKIAAFEEDFAMQCPICRVARIKTQETSTGKRYYVCSDKYCTFISWGKPYHLVCPKCGSPFLVESSASNGKPILKCPRATCFHWQRHPFDTSGENTPRDLPSSQVSWGNPVAPTPRKRVVKRKVVRRKR